MESMKRKHTNWDKKDDVELIEIWAQYDSESRKSKRNSHVYAEIAKKMGDRYTGQEVHSKIKNLGARYRYVFI